MMNDSDIDKMKKSFRHSYKMRRVFLVFGLFHLGLAVFCGKILYEYVDHILSFTFITDDPTPVMIYHYAVSDSIAFVSLVNVALFMIVTGGNMMVRGLIEDPKDKLIAYLLERDERKPEDNFG